MNGAGITIFWFLSCLLVTRCLAYYGSLINAVEDSVEAENYTYYTYTERGPFVLVLESLNGQ